MLHTANIRRFNAGHQAATETPASSSLQSSLDDFDFPPLPSGLTELVPLPDLPSPLSLSFILNMIKTEKEAYERSTREIDFDVNDLSSPRNTHCSRRGEISVVYVKLP